MCKLYFNLFTKAKFERLVKKKKKNLLQES